MGNSTWNSFAYADYSTATRSLSRDARFTAKSVKTSNDARFSFDPKTIKLRESRDSDSNPLSTPIIIGVDVSGSMGIIPEILAKEKLGKLVEGIQTEKPVTDPHIMFMAIGDAIHDQAPLQVTQFEADMRIVEQLTDLWLEGNGGDNGWESYDLPWYFASQYTSTDSWEKRGKKGYLFTMGDEEFPKASAEVNAKIFGADSKKMTSMEALAEAQKTYKVFHLIIEQGSHCRRANREKVVSEWTEALGPNAILVNNYEMISEIILSIIMVAEGADPVEVIQSFEDPNAKAAVEYSLQSVL